ncbi:MAG: tail fiber assembly protein [Hafnia alvei]|uniref:tail fiber assembly protein n=1 Tax=Hafnia alvei TaxID=569 RepID=UPI00290E71CD|nr:tail fiber assembly protein [Hafnia alvei]MDU7482387.1 tail fiber assembly protein [Hafnia alvei]
MMHLKNIKAGNPKTVEQYQLTRDFDVKWLWSEDDKNWYEEQKNFQPDTLKIAYDHTGIICCIEKDVSLINPEGMSVIELLDITANRRADVSGNWIYQDGQVIKRTYTRDELIAQAATEKARLFAEASTCIAPLQDSVDLGMATEAEKISLTAWRTFRVLLSRVDTSTAPDVVWPEMPTV